MKLVSNPYSLITRLLKAKYFARGYYYGADIGHNPIYVWCSICSVKDVIWRGFQCSLCIGEIIRVWDHLWLHNVDCILSTIYQHLIIIDSLNMEFINGLFENNRAIRSIFNTPLWIWYFMICLVGSLIRMVFIRFRVHIETLWTITWKLYKHRVSGNCVGLYGQ